MKKLYLRYATSEYVLLIKLIRTINALAHTPQCPDIYSPEDEGVAELLQLNKQLHITDLPVGYLLESPVLFKIKDALLNELIRRYRRKLTLVYLYYKSDEDINMEGYVLRDDIENCRKENKLTKECLLSLYYKLKVVPSRLYYDLLEIRAKTWGGTFIIHALPWNIDWKKVDAIELRDYWREKIIYCSTQEVCKKEKQYLKEVKLYASELLRRWKKETRITDYI